MSSIYLKISSLLIRTLSKPIANRIKAQAREHEGFRRICISFAQSVHRLDMRLRLGLLQDHAAIDRQIAKEAAEAKAKRAHSDIPTVKTEAQTKADANATAKSKEKLERLEKEKKTKPRIRPLSEAKAIDSGANFISEGFLFSVGLGLIVFETARSRRKENKRRDDVAERIAELEAREQALTDRLESVDEELQELRKEKNWFWNTKAGENKERKRGSVREEVEKKVSEKHKEQEEADNSLPVHDRMQSQDKT